MGQREPRVGREFDWLIPPKRRSSPLDWVRDRLPDSSTPWRTGIQAALILYLQFALSLTGLTYGLIAVLLVAQVVVPLLLVMKFGWPAAIALALAAFAVATGEPPKRSDVEL